MTHISAQLAETGSRSPSPLSDGGAARWRVALVGHACCPGMGSEPGLTWNWAVQLAAFHEVWVFTHPQYRQRIEAELAQRPHEGLHFVFVDTHSRLDRWDPARGERGIRWHYGLWQKQVVRAVARTHHQHPFDLVHHVSWGSLNQPPLLWRLSVPFVWGPIGGGQRWPAAFLNYAPGAAWRERLRARTVAAARWRPAVRRAVRGADLVLVTNQETADLVARLRPRRLQIEVDNGIPHERLLDAVPQKQAGDRLRMLWAGRCEARKGLPIALEAMAMCGDERLELVVAGDGPARAAWEARARQLGLHQRARFLGQVPPERMKDLFAAADVFLFTSLRDSMGSVVLEAMAHALPILTLDHQGVAQLVDDEAGIKVAVTEPQQTVGHMAEAMRRLLEGPGERLRLAHGALACAAQHTWARRAAKMARLYDEVLCAHRAV